MYPRTVETNEEWREATWVLPANSGTIKVRQFNGNPAFLNIDCRYISGDLDLIFNKILQSARETVLVFDKEDEMVENDLEVAQYTPKDGGREDVQNLYCALLAAGNRETAATSVYNRLMKMNDPDERFTEMHFYCE